MAPSIIVSTLLLLAGCGASAREGIASGPSNPAPSSIALSGQVVDAPVSGAVVSAYHVQPGGIIGEGADSVRSYPVPPPQFLAVSAPSSPGDGKFSLSLPDRSPVLLESKGGSYIDPISGEPRQLASQETLMAAVPDPAAGPVQITPWSTVAARLALAKARSGVPVEQAFREANASLAAHFSLQSLLNPTSAEDRSDLRLSLGGLAQLGHNLNTEPASLRNGLAHDLEDGRFDGLHEGRPIPLVSTLPAQGLATGVLPPTAATTSLAGALGTFAASVSNPGDSPSADLVSSLTTSTGDVSPTPATYVSPYTITYTNSVESLTADFSESPRNDSTLESTRPPYASWYLVSAYPQGQLPWGPIATNYPAPIVPDGVDAVTWKRERLVATGLKYRGYNYQHHHVPDWDPEPYNWPQWISVTLGHNSAGIDCSDFSSWNYNYGLGMTLVTAVANQASATAIPGPNGATVQAQVVAQATSSSPVDYSSLTSTLVTGDLLYIRGNSASAPGTGVTHVIMWVGSIGSSPDGMPLVLDSHDNQPVVKDSTGAIIPAGVQLRPFIEGSWYHRAFDHAHRIVY